MSPINAAHNDNSVLNGTKWKKEVVQKEEKKTKKERKRKKLINFVHFLIC